MSKIRYIGNKVTEGTASSFLLSLRADNNIPSTPISFPVSDFWFAIKNKYNIEWKYQFTSTASNISINEDDRLIQIPVTEYVVNRINDAGYSAGVLLLFDAINIAINTYSSKTFISILQLAVGANFYELTIGNDEVGVYANSNSQILLSNDYTYQNFSYQNDLTLLTSNTMTSGSSDVYTKKYEKSGTLTRNYKKVLNSRSHTQGTLPATKITTGKKLDINKFKIEPFSDGLTIFFDDEKENVNSVLGVPLIHKASSLGNKDVIISNTVSDTVSSNDFDVRLLSRNENILLKNTEIFSNPNDFNAVSMKTTRKFTSKNYDKIVTQKYKEEKFEPYTENFGIFTTADDDFSTSTVTNNSEYDILDQKQISITLDFKNDQDAFLTNTVIPYNTPGSADNIAYRNQVNFLFGENKSIVSSNSFPTAYWNFNNNRWEYLDANALNIDNTAYSDASSNSDVVFPKENASITADYKNNITNFLGKKNICFSPSYREDGSLINRNKGIKYNKSFVMKPTSTYGFPQKSNWQPHNNHLLKMSNYITEDFLLEKIVVKGKFTSNGELPKRKGNYSLSNNTQYSIYEKYAHKSKDPEYVSSGFTFFILNERKNFDFDKQKVVIDAGEFIYDDSTKNKFNLEYFYELDSNNKLVSKDSANNKFYYLTKSTQINSNINDHFIVKDNIDWSTDYNLKIEDLTIADSEVYDINHAYNQVKNTSIRELVTYSNMLVLSSLAKHHNNADDKITKGVDLFLNKISTDENITPNLNIKEKDFIINSNVKTTNASSGSDVSRYSISSNLNKVEGAKSIHLLRFSSETLESISQIPYSALLSYLIDEKLTFLIDHSITDHHGPAFESNLNFIFKNGSGNGTSSISNKTYNFIPTEDINGTTWNNNLSSNNFEANKDLFVGLIANTLVQINSIAKISLLDGATEISTYNFLDIVENSSDVTEYNKSSEDYYSIKIKILGKYYPIDTLLQREVDNASIMYQKSSVIIYAGTPDVYEENHIDFLECDIDGQPNLVGVNSERVIDSKDVLSSKVDKYNNDFYGEIHSGNASNKALISNYLLKPEDELVFGINSYSNGDLVPTMFRLHDRLEITLIGKEYSKKNRQKSNESKAIRKVIEGDAYLRKSTEGMRFLNSNYFDRVYQNKNTTRPLNTKEFFENRESIDSMSTGKFNTWGSFNTFFESKYVDKKDTSKKVKPRYYFDSVLPTFTDVLLTCFEKLPYKSLELSDYRFVVDSLDSNSSESDISNYFKDLYYSFQITDKFNSSILESDLQKYFLCKDEWCDRFIFHDYEDTAGNYFNVSNNRKIYNSILTPIKNNVDLQADASNVIDGYARKISLLDAWDLFGFNIKYDIQSYSSNCKTADDDVVISNYLSTYYNYDNASDNKNRTSLKAINNDVVSFKTSSFDNITLDFDSIKLQNNLAVNSTIQKPAGFSQKWSLVLHEIGQNDLSGYIQRVNDLNSENITTKNYLKNKAADGFYHYSLPIPLSLTIFDANDSRAVKHCYLYLGKANEGAFDITDSNTWLNVLYIPLEIYDARTTSTNTAQFASTRNDDYGGASNSLFFDDTIYNSTNSNGYKTYIGKYISDVSYDIHNSSNSAQYDILKAFTTFKSYSDITTLTPTAIFHGSTNFYISYPKFKLGDGSTPVYKNKNNVDILRNKKVNNLKQNYINFDYYESSLDYLNSHKEIDIRSELSLDYHLNEKVYIGKCYKLSNNASEETNTEIVLKYNNTTNVGLDYPELEVFSIKSTGSVFGSIYNKNIAKTFDFNSSNVIRVYEPELKSIEDTSRFNDDVSNSWSSPYFDIKLENVAKCQDVFMYEDASNSYKALSSVAEGGTPITIEQYNNSASAISNNQKNITSKRSGSSIFNIKDSVTKWDEDLNFDEYDSEENKNDHINNFFYGFSKSDHKFPIKKLEGYKYGVYSGNKSVVSHKFSSKSFGNFSDKVMGSENSAYTEIKEDNDYVVVYPVLKLYVNEFYTYVNSSQQSYNKDIYSRSNYPFIENESNSISPYYNT